MERQQNLHEPEITNNFLVQAKEEGAISRYKNRRTMPSIAFNLNVTAIYFGTYLDQSDIARMAGVSRQAVNQIIKRTISGIWSESSWSLKERFGQIPPATKNPSISRERMPEILKERFAESKNTSKKISATLKKYQTSKKAQFRQNKRDTWDRIKRIIETSDDEAQVQKSLDILDYNHAQALSRDEKYFSTFTQAFGHRPINFSSSIYDQLRFAGIPVLRRKNQVLRETNSLATSYHIPNRFIERVIEYLKTTPLEKAITSKVIQIAGSQEVPKPTTNDFLKTTNYKYVFGGKLRINTMRLAKLKIDREKLFSDCPIPVFYYKNHGYFVNSQNYEGLQKFLKIRLEKLGYFQ